MQSSGLRTPKKLSSYWFCNNRKNSLFTITTFFRQRRLLCVALWTFNFLFFPTAIARNIKESWLSAIDTVNVQSLRAGGAGLVFFLNFSFTPGTPYVYGRFFA